MLATFLFCSVLSANAAETKIINIWSGREQIVPGSGKWTLTAIHGRVIAQENGKIRLNIAALSPGTSVDADLQINRRTSKVTIWSPQPLAFMPPVRFTDEHLAKVFRRYGWNEKTIGSADFPEICISSAMPGPKATTTGRKVLALVFPEKLDFPIKFGDNWVNISLMYAKIPGTLSVYINNKEQVVDIDGNASYLMLEKKNISIFIFSPGYDLKNIDNVLLIKKLIKENKK